MKPYRRLAGQGIISGFGQVAILVLLVLAALAILAPVRSYRNLRRELEASTRRLNELEILYPLYTELVALDSPAKWEQLQTPPRQKLKEPDVVAVPDRFMKLAADCAVEIGLVSPHVEIEQGQRILRVEVQALGTYAQLKQFLASLAQMPVLARLEKVDVKREGSREQFNVLAILALE